MMLINRVKHIALIWILLFSFILSAADKEITFIELLNTENLRCKDVYNAGKSFDSYIFQNPKAPFSNNFIKVKVPLHLIGGNDFILINESKLLHLDVFIPNRNGYDSINLGLSSLENRVNGLHFYFFPIHLNNYNVENGDFIFYMKPSGFNLNRRYPMYVMSHYDVYDTFFKKENIARSWTVFMAIMFCVNLLLYNLFKEKLFIYLSILVVAVFLYNGIRNSNIIFSLLNFNSSDISIYFRILGLYSIFFAWQHFIKGLKVKSKLLNYYYIAVNVLMVISFIIALFKIDSLIRVLGLIALLSLGYLPLAMVVIMKKGLSSYLKNLRIPLIIFIAQIFMIKLPMNLGVINEYLFFMEGGYFVFSIVILLINAIVLRYVLEKNNRTSMVLNTQNQKFAMKLHDEVSPLFLAAKMEFERGNRYLSKYYVQEAENLINNNTSQTEVKAHWEYNFNKLFIDYSELNIKDQLIIKHLVDYQVKTDIIEQLYIIIRELLQNTNKYANSNSVVIRSFVINNRAFIYYCDDGNGVDLNKKKDGIGLKNIKRRCAEIEAQVKIKSEVNKGFKCLIHFKLHSY